MRFLPAIVVFGAAGAAYLYTHDENFAKSFSLSQFLSNEDEAVATQDLPPEQLADAPPEQIVAVPGPDVTNFAEIFRFDITPQFVTERWSRVSTGLSDVRMQGYRVPLVTGVEPGDLAGSLTYYFDSRPRLQRITFIGTTGDPSRLINFLAQQYGFHRYQHGNARVTTFRSRFRWTGVLNITPAEVLDHQLTATNYRVDLSIAR